LVTSALLYLMQLLIDTGPDVIVESKMPVLLDWIGKTPDARPIVDPTKPDRLPDPAPGPQDPRPPESGVTEGYGTPLHPPAPPPVGPTFERPGITDGPLMTIYKVSPSYPARAILNGTSGHVTVSYDVMANGTVANVVVLESSNRLFEAAAIEAAYRFRYKPRIVEGIAQETYGLRNRFVFRMDE
jgi:protein TonB